MTLYVLRHAIAEDRLPGRPDSSRQLTGTGRSRCRRVLAHARRANVEPRAILASPYDRAAQTAAIARAELGCESEPIVTSALLPSGSVHDLWNVVRDHAAGGDVMVVGHNPQLSTLVTWLLGAREDALWLKKSGLAALDIGGRGAFSRAELSWLLAPGLAGR